MRCSRFLMADQLEPTVQKAGELLVTVVGQDLETDGDGRFRIAQEGRQGPCDLDS